MEYKDIINLFVPILFNGVILFMFQKVMNVKFEESNLKNQMKKKIYDEYFEIIKALYDYVYVTMETEYFLEPISKEAGIYEEDELQEHMRSVTLLCKKMHVHFNTYKKILGVEKELSEQHKKLMEILETYEKSDDFYEIYNEICPIVENMHEVIVEKMF